jgi:hypothetical protein
MMASEQNVSRTVIKTQRNNGIKLGLYLLKSVLVFFKNPGNGWA